ncbi:MAG: ScyD/ScyE family protein [Gemmatimonadaceae bacterium]
MTQHLKYLGLATASLAFLAFLAACGGRDDTALPSEAVSAEITAGTAVSVFATGLINPRGLEFGPDGNLYVAEAGLGGTTLTVGQCAQDAPPTGPYRGGKTARISRIAPNGDRTTVVDGLASGLNANGGIIGVADVAFIGTTLYALQAGGGCSHGNPDVPASVIRVGPAGTWSVLADLGAYRLAHPGSNPERTEPEGNHYNMTTSGDALLVVDANHELVERVTLGGQVSLVADIFASLGTSIVPTAIESRNGSASEAVVGDLSGFPLFNGAARILRIGPDGAVTPVATGLTMVLAVEFDRAGRIYALEAVRCPTTGPCGPSPATAGTGRVVHLTRRGTIEVVATGLTFPTGMTFGPDGNLYVSNFGFLNTGPGAGQIVKIDVPWNQP